MGLYRSLGSVLCLRCCYFDFREMTFRVIYGKVLAPQFLSSESSGSGFVFLSMWRSLFPILVRHPDAWLVPFNCMSFGKCVCVCNKHTKHFPIA